MGKLIIVDGLNAAINILAVEYLIKTNDRNEYTRQINRLYLLDSLGLERLTHALSFNMHIGNLGEMITQGDYDYQVEVLSNFLNDKK